MKKYKNFIHKYFVIGLILLLPVIITFLLTIVYLYKTKETLDVNKVVELQQKKDYIYGTGLKDDIYQYKMALAKKCPAKIMAFGTSRVLQFRKNFFTASFTNVGGSVPYINIGRIFLEESLKYNKPKIMIMGIDYWWFNEKFDNSKNVVSSYQPDMQSLVSTVIKYLYSGKIGKKEFIKTIFYNNDKKMTIYKPIGIVASKNSEGYLPDGSYLFTNLYTGENKVFKDRRFKDTLHRIENEGFRFEYASKVNPKALNELEKIREICKKNNIKLILFFPPFSQTVYDELNKRKEDYKYFKELHNYLDKNKIKYYDFTNPATFGSNDCESIDGFHGGDVAYARILLKIADKDETLNKYINRNYLEESIKKNKNHAVIFDANKYKFKETDFLGLGCKK